MNTIKISCLLCLVLLAGGCSRTRESAPDQTQKPAAEKPAAASADRPGEEPLPPPAYETGIPEEMRAIIDKTFTGDLDEIVKRRVIRAGVPFNRSFYFVDKGVQRGLSVPST